MLQKKVALFLVFMILLSNSVLAVQPVQPIGDISALVRDSTQQMQDFCRNEWNAKEQSFKAEIEAQKVDLEGKYKQILWFDRILTLILVMFGVFLANTFRRWFDHRAQKRVKTIDSLEKDLGNPPKPIKEYMENE